MNIKIKDLEKKLLLSTKAYECMKMEKKTDPLREENSRLKKTIDEMESKAIHLRYEIKKHMERQPSSCRVCVARSSLITKDSFTIPELTIEDLSRKEADLKILHKKIDDLKYVCRERKRKNDEYQEELNLSEHRKAELEYKYKQLKIICERRFDEIQKLKENMPPNTTK